MDIRKVDLWGWRGISLTTGQVSLVLTPEAGGRITSLKLDGVEAFFTLPELRGRHFKVAETADVRAKKRELGWLHYGGYKTWLAPQDRWTDGLPFLDLDSGSYDVAVHERPKGAGVRMTSPVCRETGIQLVRTVSMSEGGHVVIDQAMINRSSAEVTWGLWDVTQVKGPGLALLPIAQGSRFEAGVKAYANEGRSLEAMNQYVRISGGLATVTCGEVETFKYGADSMEGWIVGLLDLSRDRWLAYLKIFEPIRAATYPHQVTVEVYDSGSYPYFELEVHSPLRGLKPGESYTYSEMWVLDWLPKSFDVERVGAWVEEMIRGNEHDLSRRTPLG